MSCSQFGIVAYLLYKCVGQGVSGDPILPGCHPPNAKNYSMSVKRQILHIDDDPEFTQLAAEYLQDLGYETKSINDPSIFISQVPVIQERVVLLDVDMPGINGLDILKKLKANDGGIQVIMLTGIVSQTTILRSMSRGAEALFFKPLVEIKPVADALAICFQKIDRWRRTLENLSQYQRA
jgi:CheY-like chemotaxis protein